MTDEFLKKIADYNKQNDIEKDLSPQGQSDEDLKTLVDVLNFTNIINPNAKAPKLSVEGYVKWLEVRLSLLKDTITKARNMFQQMDKQGGVQMCEQALKELE